MTDLATLAQEAYDSFTTILRDEDVITTLKDEASDWVYDLMRNAHGDMLPDDWRYETTRAAVGFIAHAGVDDPADDAAEFADDTVDVYTADRLKWLVSHSGRVGYCDEASHELGVESGDIVRLIGMGQYVEAREIFDYVYASLTEELALRGEA